MSYGWLKFPAWSIDRVAFSRRWNPPNLGVMRTANATTTLERAQIGGEDVDCVSVAAGTSEELAHRTIENAECRERRPRALIVLNGVTALLPLACGRRSWRGLLARQK
jgi:hypothetical protein